MITQIEQAVIDFYKRMADENRLPFEWGSLATYPENWDVWLKQNSILRAPAVWVGFTRWDAPQQEDHRQRVRARFIIVVMSENQRGEEATRHGDPVSPATKPGSYQLLATAAALIAGQTLEIEIDTIRVGASFPVRPPEALKERKVAFQAFEFTTSFALTDLQNILADLAPYEVAHANWDIPPLGVVGSAGLPDDARANATDHVELEQDE